MTMDSFEMELKFNLQHNPKPITYTEQVSKIFKLLMWYTPNVGSYQAQEDCIIDSKYISDELFLYFCSKANISMDEVKCEMYTQSNIIDNQIRNLVPGQTKFKIIMTYGNSKTKNLSKMQSLLEHLRNSIAHGRFITANNSTFTGFDYGGKLYNFFIEIDLSYLLSILCSISPIDRDIEQQFSSNTIGYYFENLIRDRLSSLGGYSVIVDVRSFLGSNKFIPDILVKSSFLNRTIALDIKVYNNLNSVFGNEKNSPITVYSKHFDLFCILLVIPKKPISSSTITNLNKHNYLVLDCFRLKDFLNGEDVLSDQLKQVALNKP